MLDEHEYNFHGMILRCVRYGNPDNKKILAMHGWLDNSATFTKLAPMLEDEYCIDCWEFMGHGQSDHLPRSAHYHFIDVIPHFSGILQEFYQKEPCIVMGHSLGAAVATVMASLIPELITHCIAIEGLGPMTGTTEECWQQLHAYLKCQFKFTHNRQYESLEKAAEIKSIKTKIEYEDALLLCQRGMVMSEQGYVWQHDKRLSDPSPLKLTEEQVRTILSNIKVPTCLIQASDGFHGELFKQRSAFVTHKKVHYMLKGGHHIHMEQPEEVSKIIKDFL